MFSSNYSEADSLPVRHGPHAPGNINLDSSAEPAHVRTNAFGIRGESRTPSKGSIDGVANKKKKKKITLTKSRLASCQWFFALFPKSKVTKWTVVDSFTPIARPRWPFVGDGSALGAAKSCPLDNKVSPQSTDSHVRESGHLGGVVNCLRCRRVFQVDASPAPCRAVQSSGNAYWIGDQKKLNWN